MLSFRVILAQHSRRSTSLAHTLAPLLHFSDRDENLVTETPFSRPLFSSTSALFHFPYPASPAFATHTKTAGCVPTIPILERVHPERSRRVARRNAQVLSFHILAHSFARTKTSTLLFSNTSTLFSATGAPQLFWNQYLPHSFYRDGGYPLPFQKSQIPSGPATQRQNVRRSAAEQTIKAGRNPFTQVGDPEGGDDSGEYIHGVMRAQDQDGGHLEKDEQNGSGREPLSVQAGQLNRPESRDGDMIGHKQRREPWIVPNHVGWRRQRADGLHQLAQGHQQGQSEERANTSAEKPASQQKKSQRVNQTGAYDQKRVSSSGISRKIRIEPRSQVVRS